MNQRVVKLIALADFEGEVPPPGPVRLVLTESHTSRESIPATETALSLQGINSQGEIAWLYESHTVLTPGGTPLPGIETSIYRAMPQLHALVRDYLLQRGYQVRNGAYGIPKSVYPIRAQFEIVEWSENGDDEFVVRLRTDNDHLNCHRCPACGATLETLREDGQAWQFCLNCGLTARPYSSMR